MGIILTIGVFLVKGLRYILKTNNWKLRLSFLPPREFYVRYSERWCIIWLCL
jgi:hypothetical protein